MPVYGSAAIGFCLHYAQFSSKANANRASNPFAAKLSLPVLRLKTSTA